MPEPVAWEWAQHISEDWQALFGPAGPSYRRLADTGLTVTPTACEVWLIRRAGRSFRG
ncbi:hypothetical protein [Streptosporangium canum]|uniref:hypothetical protein n=1 Tax=Streptosporangium canum TaxID=324952 RepID=UPI0037A88725